MIKPPTELGVVFSGAGEGDLRSDRDARKRFSAAVGVQSEWATVRQVHGSNVIEVSEPGPAGDGDAMWTSVAGLPLAVFTADCLAVVAHSSSAVGVAHAGWRGARAGVVTALVDSMSASGHQLESLWIGPGIGPCCFEVGSDVSEFFPPERRSRTSWDTPSVDLVGSVRAELTGVSVWSANACTKHDPGWFSHRRDATPDRQLGMGWLT